MYMGGSFIYNSNLSFQGYPLRDRINKFVLRTLETGLMDAWIKSQSDKRARHSKVIIKINDSGGPRDDYITFVPFPSEKIHGTAQETWATIFI